MPTLYIRNEDNTDWYIIMLQGELYLDDLVDVSSGSPSDGNTINWSSGSSAWVLGTPLAYEGLSKITVSSGSPANPATGDLWINTA